MPRAPQRTPPVFRGNHDPLHFSAVSEGQHVWVWIREWLPGVVKEKSHAYVKVSFKKNGADTTKTFGYDLQGKLLERSSSWFSLNPPTPHVNDWKNSPYQHPGSSLKMKIDDLFQLDFKEWKKEYFNVVDHIERKKAVETRLADRILEKILKTLLPIVQDEKRDSDINVTVDGMKVTGTFRSHDEIRGIEMYMPRLETDVGIDYRKKNFGWYKDFSKFLDSRLEPLIQQKTIYETQLIQMKETLERHVHDQDEWEQCERAFEIGGPNSIKLYFIDEILKSLSAFVKYQSAKIQKDHWDWGAPKQLILFPDVDEMMQTIKDSA